MAAQNPFDLETTTELEIICQKLKLSKEFQNQVLKFSQQYIDQIGLENVVVSLIWKNFSCIPEENELEHLHVIGFTKEGAASLESFIEAKVTHYTLSNWLYLYLDVILHPKEPKSLSYPFSNGNKNGEWFNLEPSITSGSGFVNTSERPLRCINVASLKMMRQFTDGEEKDAERRKQRKTRKDCFIFLPGNLCFTLHISYLLCSGTP